MKKFAFLLLLIPGVIKAEIRFMTNPKALLKSTNTWTASQTFTSSTTFKDITVTGCTGCGGGGSLVVADSDTLKGKNSIYYASHTWTASQEFSSTTISGNLGVAGGSVSVRGLNAGYAIDGGSIFFSTWNQCGGYRQASSSGSIASNTTISITPSQFGGAVFCGTPMVCEIEGVNTAVTSIRFKDTLSTTLIQIFNADAINGKKFSLTNVWVK